MSTSYRLISLSFQDMIRFWQTYHFIWKEGRIGEWVLEMGVKVDPLYSLEKIHKVFNKVPLPKQKVPPHSLEQLRKKEKHLRKCLMNLTHFQALSMKLVTTDTFPMCVWIQVIFKIFVFIADFVGLRM